MSRTCFGCSNLRQKSDIGVVWLCLKLNNQKVGEDTYYHFQLPKPVEGCWEAFEEELPIDSAKVVSGKLPPLP